MWASAHAVYSAAVARPAFSVTIDSVPALSFHAYSVPQPAENTPDLNAYWPGGNESGTVNIAVSLSSAPAETEMLSCTLALAVVELEIDQNDGVSAWREGLAERHLLAAGGLAGLDRRAAQSHLERPRRGGWSGDWRSRRVRHAAQR